jgi:hypothetical protein
VLRRGGAAGYPPVVRATAGGDSVPCYLQGRTAGAWEDVGDPITVSILNDWREPFRPDNRYLATKVGDDWFAETGPKTTCVEVVDGNSAATLDCETGNLTFQDTVSARVLAGPPCGPPQEGGSESWPAATGGDRYRRWLSGRTPRSYVSPGVPTE